MKAFSTACTLLFLTFSTTLQAEEKENCAAKLSNSQKILSEIIVRKKHPAKVSVIDQLNANFQELETCLAEISILLTQTAPEFHVNLRSESMILNEGKLQIINFTTATDIFGADDRILHLGGITVPTGGFYHISFSTTINANGKTLGTATRLSNPSRDDVFFDVNVNGEMKLRAWKSEGPIRESVGISGILRLKESDVLTITGFLHKGGDLDGQQTEARYPNLFITRIR